MLSRVAAAIYWAARYVERAENVALEVEQLGQRLLDEAARVEAVEAHAVLDPVKRRRDVAVLDHALLGHELEVAGDLAPGVGEDRPSRLGCALLDVDEEDAPPPEGEGKRDLAPDPPGPHHHDSGVIHTRGHRGHARSRP